jgi:hypothetical protein
MLIKLTRKVANDEKDTKIVQNFLLFLVGNKVNYVFCMLV